MQPKLHPSDTTSQTKRAFAILGAALGLGIVFDFLFFGKLPGISFPLYVTLVLSILYYAAYRSKIAFSMTAASLGVPILFFSWMVMIWSDGLLIFLNSIVTLYLLGLFLRVVFKPRLKDYVLLDYVRPLAEIPVEILNRFSSPISEALAGSKIMAKHKNMTQVVRGIFITIPVLVLFVVLFASADLVFGRFVSNIFSFHLSEDFVPRVMLVGIVSLIFAGVLAYITQKQTIVAAKAQHAAAVTKDRLSLVEVTILFSALNILFLGFIILQLTYLFGGEQNVMRLGFTYAEYARKGFFELIAVAVLAFALITVTEKLLLKTSTTHSPRFKFLAGALIAQVLVVMVSAFNRLSLYESAYGFTTLRLHSHIFLVWLAIVFGFLLYKIFRDHRESTFAFLIFTSIVTFMVGINIVNTNAFVARKNIERYYATGKIDDQYLSSLSDDAIVDIVRLLDTEDKELQKSLAGALYYRRQRLMDDKKHWQSYNLSRESALNALEVRRAVLEDNKDYSKGRY